MWWPLVHADLVDPAAKVRADGDVGTGGDDPLGDGVVGEFGEDPPEGLLRGRTSGGDRRRQRLREPGVVGFDGVAAQPVRHRGAEVTFWCPRGESVPFVLHGQTASGPQFGDLRLVEESCVIELIGGDR